MVIIVGFLNSKSKFPKQSYFPPSISQQQQSSRRRVNPHLRRFKFCSPSRRDEVCSRLGGSEGANSSTLPNQSSLILLYLQSTMYAIFALRGLGTKQFLTKSHFAVKNVENKLRYNGFSVNVYVFLYVCVYRLC